MKRRTLITLLLLCVVKFQVLAQSHLGQSWVIGTFGYQIKFETIGITHDTSLLTPNIQTGFMEGTSNICDSNGNMRYLSNGFNIYHPDGSFVEEGDTIVPHDFYMYQTSGSLQPQSSIFLPFEGGITYFITPTVNDTELNNIFNNVYPDGRATSNLLLYNKIDDNANNGLGKVIQRMVPLMENIPLAKTQMMACKHGNGKDWWLFKMAGDANKVYKFLFTKDSVVYRGEQTFPYPFRGYWDLSGQMMFSNDGKKFASTFSVEHTGYGEVFTADFDRCSGDLTNLQRIFIPAQITPGPNGNFADSANTGLYFSPNGKFLYVSKFGAILQYDLTDNTVYKVYGTDTTVAEFQGYASMYIGYNNKIYIGTHNGTSKQMSVIDNPDGKGFNCNFCRKCLRSQSYFGYLFSPPCMPNYELGSDSTHCWPLGVAEVSPEGRNIKVYPNPADKMIRFEYPLEDRESSLQLFDMYGRKRQVVILLAGSSQVTMDIHQLENGVYLYRYVSKNHKELSGKMIVEH